MDKHILNIPSGLLERLSSDEKVHVDTMATIKEYIDILAESKLFFFEEYTNHGLVHVEDTLRCIEFLIAKETFEELTAVDVSVLVLSVVLHDIGMHVEYSTFVKMINGECDSSRIKELDKKTWGELWEDYLYNLKFLSDKVKIEMFGTSHVFPPKLVEQDSLTGLDRKVIGEFIRRHHPRIAHEFAVGGIHGTNGLVSFGKGIIKDSTRKIAGVIARSHGMNVRDTFNYLRSHFSKTWKIPLNIKVIYLMVLVRIGDYLQIDSSRTKEVVIKLKNFGSAYSLQEHKTHLAIEHINFDCEDPELIFVQANPESSRMFVKIKTLLESIQSELDLSWAILGEVYGLNKKLNLRYRRIDSNLFDDEVINGFEYVPQKVSFKINNSLSKLLIAPLYNNHPTYGVRELVQNSMDACLERIALEREENNPYSPQVKVCVDKQEDGQYLFSIKDNGIGMNLSQILELFLTVGSSFITTPEWKKMADKGEVYRNGRFGIGVLAAFLIGEEIKVETKCKEEGYKYEFVTTLEEEFIEIKKVEDEGFEVGTRIEIGVAQEKIEYFIESFNTTGLVGGRTWFGWVVNNEVDVKYYFENKEVKSTLISRYDKEKYMVANHSLANYGEILWRPNSLIEEVNNYEASIICNNIYITYYSSKRSFKDFISNEKRWLWQYLPSLQIKDIYNRLPLKIDRTDLDSPYCKYEFEKELFGEVVKDFIAQVLILDISTLSGSKLSDSNFMVNGAPITRIDAHLLFNSSGYTLNLNYFLKKMSSKFQFLIEIDWFTKRNLWNYNFFSDILYRINHKLNNILYCLFYHKWQRQFTINKCSNKDFYIANFTVDDRNNIHEYMYEDFKLVNNSSGSVVNLDSGGVDIYYKKDKFSNEEIEEKTIRLGEIYNKLKHNDLDLIIAECPLDSTEEFDSSPLNSILEEYLERYFGDNIFIPYEMEERKKMYELAFEELQENISYHMNGRRRITL